MGGGGGGAGEGGISLPCKYCVGRNSVRLIR